MNFFNIEDVLWTGIIARQKLGMELYDDDMFEYSIFSPNDYILKFHCLVSEYSAVHKASPENMRISWHQLKAQEECSDLMKSVSKMIKWWKS